MYRIKEFAAMTGLPPSKIRFYEKHGLLATRREENGYRVFSPEDAFRANAFRVLLQYGFTVEQAVAMLDAEQGTEEFKRSLEDQQGNCAARPTCCATGWRRSKARSRWSTGAAGRPSRLWTRPTSCT